MLAFLGGTGPEGKGLALRLALAGEATIIGSRDAARGAAAALELADTFPGTSIEGSDNAGAATAGNVVFLAFPYEGQRTTLEQLGAALAGENCGQRDCPNGVRAGGRAPGPSMSRPGRQPKRPRKSCPIPRLSPPSRT